MPVYSLGITTKSSKSRGVLLLKLTPVEPATCLLIHAGSWLLIGNGIGSTKSPFILNNHFMVLCRACGPFPLFTRLSVLLCILPPPRCGRNLLNLFCSHLILQTRGADVEHGANREHELRLPVRRAVQLRGNQ